MESLDRYYNPKIRREVEIFDTAFAIVIVVLFIIALLNYNFFKDVAQDWILLYGGFGLIVISFLLDLIPQLFDPGFMVFLAMAIGMSLFSATIFITIGSFFGGLVGYELGRKYGFRFICPLFERNDMEKTLNFWQKYGKFIAFLGALLPLPYFPLIFGALGMKRKEFVFWGLIPRIMSFIIFSTFVHFGITFWHGL